MKYLNALEKIREEIKRKNVRSEYIRGLDLAIDLAYMYTENIQMAEIDKDDLTKFIEDEIG